MFISCLDQKSALHKRKNTPNYDLRALLNSASLTTKARSPFHKEETKKTWHILPKPHKKSWTHFESSLAQIQIVNLSKWHLDMNFESDSKIFCKFFMLFLRYFSFESEAKLGVKIWKSRFFKNEVLNQKSGAVKVLVYASTVSDDCGDLGNVKLAMPPAFEQIL